MPNWTQEHDAHIARECEGLQVTKSETGKWVYYQPPSKHALASWLPVPHYNYNAGLRDRAAEAWRKQGEGREYMVRSALAWGKDERLERAAVWPVNVPAIQAEGEHALLWALYLATKKDGEE